MYAHISKYLRIPKYSFFFLIFFWVAICHSFMFIFFHTIQYRTQLDHITQFMMRLGLADVYEWNQWIFLGSHHISNCDEAWAGCCFSMEPVVFKVTVSSGIFWPSSPTGIRTCNPHIRGSSRAVSEWQPAYLRQLIIQTVHILQLDSAVTDSLPRGSVVRPFQPYFPITQPGSSTITPPYQQRRLRAQFHTQSQQFRLFGTDCDQDRIT